MTYYVHSVEQDLAGKWYARVVINEEESIFVKFQDYPSMGDIQEKTKRVIEGELNSNLEV
jgi:hypothetical protein